MDVGILSWLAVAVLLVIVVLRWARVSSTRSQYRAPLNRNAQSASSWASADADTSNSGSNSDRHCSDVSGSSSCDTGNSDSGSSDGGGSD